MKKIIYVRKIKIGEGVPKICVPLIGKTKEEIILEAMSLKGISLDLIEWRMDFLEDLNQVEEILNVLRNEVEDMPILCTFRSKEEGGEKELSAIEYSKLNKRVISTGLTDLIDVELFKDNEVVTDLVNYAHEYNVKVVMSNHDFNDTPSEDEIISRLCKMQELDADLPKIAVMPKDASDVLVLLNATNKMVSKHADRPIITMSMAGLGVVSRMAGEIFGSAITFGSAKVASAPGQVDVKELNQILNLIHNGIKR